MNTDKIYAEHIVNEYSPKKTSKVVALRKLDAQVKRGPNIFAYTFGIIMSLVLGTGMSFAMQVIGNNTPESFILGVVLGLVGILGCSINYPIYKKILDSRKEKYSADILELAKQVSEE